MLLVEVNCYIVFATSNSHVTMLFSIIAIFLEWAIIKIVPFQAATSNNNISMPFSGIAIFLNWVKEAEMHMDLWTYNKRDITYCMGKEFCPWAALRMQYWTTNNKVKKLLYFKID